ncbi:MAG: IS110 family transposase [Chloroflexi bacterium]|nr:IS110 family transposase [Chloroflexota bacterium]
MVLTKQETKEQEIERGRVAVGIDPSRSALQIALLFPEREIPSNCRLPLEPASVNKLEELLEGRKATFAIEGAASVGQLFLLELLRQGHDLREVHPKISKNVREMFTEDHTDRKDASGLAYAVRFVPSLPSIGLSSEQAAAKRLSRLRERLVRDRTRHINRLHACLTETYGFVYHKFFREVSSKKALQFFKQYPALNDALAHPEEVRKEIGAEAWQAVKTVGKWTDGNYMRVLKREVAVSVDVILELKRLIYEIEQEMKAPPWGSNIEVLTSMPGLGTIIASTIIGNTGDLSRFKNQDSYAAYCGLAPASWQSGASGTRSKRRSRYNRHLKRAFLCLSLTQMRVSPKAHEYYNRKRKEGKTHWAALRALARQLCRVVFFMLVNAQPYSSLTTG